MWWILIPAAIGAIAAIASSSEKKERSNADDYYHMHKLDDYKDEPEDNDADNNKDDSYLLNQIIRGFRKADVRSIPIDPKMEAGDKAERELKDYVMHHENFLGCECWLNKRLKDRIGGTEGKEIDVIVVTAEKMYIFEVKNYSGHLFRNPNNLDDKNKWIRIKSAYDAGGNILRDSTNAQFEEELTYVLKEKVDFFLAKLADNGVYLNEDEISYKLVFMNSRLSILDPDILSNPNIVTRDKLDDFLNKEQTLIPEEKRVIMALIRYCLRQEGHLREDSTSLGAIADRLSSDNKLLSMDSNLTGFINSLPTWDHLILHGGRQVRGDILRLRSIFKSQDDCKLLLSKCRIEIDCPRDEPSLIHKYNQSSQLVTLRIYDDENRLITTTEGNPFQDSSIKIHAAGDSKPTTFSIYQIQEVILRGLYDYCNE